VSDVSHPQRLDAILSRYGYCSRSEARTWLKSGRIRSLNEVVRSPAAKARPTEVLVDGKPIECPDGILAAFFKPSGYVCSHNDREGPTVYELLPPRWLKRNPPVTSIGRLDKDATGLLLLTDQGELVQRLTSPRHKVAKLYEVTVDRPIQSALVNVFASGALLLEGESKPCLPANLEIVSAREARLELTEGRYHQVKRMFASQGLAVIRLHRKRFGDYELGDLRPGGWRLLELPD
jgi:16S rRNA pseudouridine516 synthase